MKLVLTGTGTSQGIPVIACRCKVCVSVNPNDRRLRTAALLEKNGTQVAIDAGPDFRQQMLNLNISHLDALIITHEHNDHVAGLDDIRPFNFIQRKSLRVFALPRVVREIRQRFAYIFSSTPYPGAPIIDLQEIKPYHELTIGNLTLMPFIVSHGDIDVLAFRTEGLIYITDANSIPLRSQEIIYGADTMVINALHQRKHHAHFNLDQAVEQVKIFGIKKAFLTHISHQMGLHDEVNKVLPNGISLAFDGQIIGI